MMVAVPRTMLPLVPALLLVSALSSLRPASGSLPPPEENFRKVEKKILDKLFSPEVYDNRMRPKGKPLKVKRYKWCQVLWHYSGPGSPRFMCGGRGQCNIAIIDFCLGLSRIL